MNKLLITPIFYLLSNMVMADDACHISDGMRFFNQLSAVLEIELDTPAKPINNLPGNLVASNKSKISSVKLVPEVYVESTEKFRSLTNKELNQVAYEKSHITIKGEGSIPIVHKSPNGKFFTVKGLMAAVEKTELKTRDKSNWFGGVDVHHIYFEGMECDNGVWSVFWGS